jgi:RNA polymerase sigma-70 factor (ECF subfamily)
MADKPRPWTEDIEAELTAAAGRGDSSAFREIVDHFDPGLRRLAYRLLRDRDRMDDALQEAYIKAYRALPDYRGRSRLGTWLYRITYNVCVDELRRSGREEWVEIDDDRIDVSADPGDHVSDRVSLVDALSRLSPGYQAVLLLVDGQGFDYQAAAEILDVSEGTVASRLHRARQALLQTLTEGSRT